MHVLKQFTKAMKALGDETRLKILRILLARKDICVCELQAILNLSQPTVSRHLKILEEAGFLESRRQAQWVVYQVQRKFEPPFLKGILDQFSSLDGDEEVKRLLKKAQEIYVHK